MLLQQEGFGVRSFDLVLERSPTAAIDGFNAEGELILSALGIATWAGSVNACALFLEPRRGTLLETRTVRGPRLGRFSDPDAPVGIVSQEAPDPSQ